MDLAKNIIFAIMGLVVLLTGIFVGAGTEVIVLGAIISVIAIVFIVLEIIKKKKLK